MKLLADLHTHSKNSRFFHANNSIEEMVLQANEMGLREIAITDHGFKHWCRTSKEKIIEARKIVNEINTWSKTKVLLGIEADIISEDGTLDVDNETIAMLDVLIIGYHRLISTDFVNYFGVYKKTPEAKQRCTNAYLNAIAKYPVTIVAHLDSVLETDLYQIGVACAEKGVMVEINNRHTRWTEDQIDDLIASDCMFVVSSDAHDRRDVGRVGRCFDMIQKYDIPTENIANVEFEENEKSDEHHEFSLYYDIYKDKVDAIVGKKDIQIAAGMTEKPKATLSNEMEEMLAKIAKEKGIKYDSRVETVYTETDENSEVELNLLDVMPEYDSEELIKQANEFLRKNSMNEFDMQNEKLETDDFVHDEQPSEKVEEKTEPAVEVKPTESVVEQPKQEESVVDAVIGGMMFAKKTKKDEPAVETKPEKPAVVKDDKAVARKKANSKLNPLALLNIDDLSDSNKN